MGVSSAFFPKFRKVIALVGSDREGERHAAADQAWRMCEENDLSLLEALDGACGGSGDKELQRQIEELEDDNRKLAEAVNVLNAQREAIPEDAGHELLRKIWSYPRVRLATVFVMAGSGFWLVDAFDRWFAHGNRFMASLTPWVKWALVFDMAMLVWSWARAEYSSSGVGVVAVKTLAVLGGLYAAATVFEGARDVTGAAIVLSLAGLLALSNICRWLVDELAHSDREAFRLLRSWFA